MTPSSLMIVKVIAFHEKNTADVLDVSTGARMPRVAIMCATPAGTNVGRIDTPEPTPGETEYSIFESGDRDIYAGLAYFGNVPAIIGFMFPQVCQMFFADLKRTIDRHASDLYSTIDGDGNLEVYHPSGTMIRIATDPEHEDLTGADIDGKWKIEKNTDRAVHVRVVVKNAGVQKADLHISPDGKVKLDHVGDLEATTGGNATISVAGSITSSAASWTHTGPVTFTDDVQVNKTLTASTDVIGGGKSLKGHKHTGVTTGGGVSGAPQ